MKPIVSALAVLAIMAAPVAAQQIVLARAPQGLLQPIGGPAQTDSFVLANAVTDRVASITLAVTGPFTVTPTNFTLSPGARITVTITPNATTTPFFNAGSVRVQTVGIPPFSVPVRLAAATPPATPVKASAVSNLIVISGLSGFRHPSSWSITNSTATALQGMLISDMPWLMPQQSDLATIPARSSALVAFASDPSRNGAAPLGAMKSTISFLYLTGSPANPVGRITATVFDINKVPMVVSQPPDAGAGETISFLPVVFDPEPASNDIFFANRGTSAFSSPLQLFYTGSGAPSSSSLLANAGSLASGIAAWYPFAPSSLFNFGIGTGTVQVRGGDPAGVAAAVTRKVTPDSVNVYTTAVPVLRSDRAAGAGDHLVFAGVEKSASAITDMFLQETAGADATYTIDFADANGLRLVPGATGSIAAFSSVNLEDVAPAGARSAIVTNTSVNAAQLAGFAAVLDASTSDEFTITDPQAGSAAANDLILPVPTGAPASSTFDAWITNGSGTSALVTVGGIPAAAPVKSRAVRRNPNGVPDVQSIVIGAGQTQQVRIPDMPFVHISGPAGAISATGRLTTFAAGGGAYGTGVPATPSALAAGAGGRVSHFFRSIDTAGVAPPGLLVAEVANKPATVRVTVAFNFPAAASPSQHFERSQDFDVAAGQMLAIPDVLRTVTNGFRDSFGDVLDVVIDVAVVGGDGRVLSYMQSVDSASGDLTFTAG